MSRVDFAHGAADRLRAACRTAARHAHTGRRLLVYCTDPDRLQRFDQLLWGFEPEAFVTHARADDPLAARAQVVLVADAAQLEGLAHDGWLLNLDDDCAPAHPTVERVLEIVSNEPADRQAARTRWQRYRSVGCTVAGHALPTAEP